MKHMTFKEQIDAIINDNPFGIRSIWGLEQYLHIGVGGIGRVANDPKKRPTIRMIKRITDGLGISMNWWRTGAGDIYDNVDSVAQLRKLIMEKEEQIKLLQETRELYKKILLERDIEVCTLNLRLNDRN